MDLKPRYVILAFAIALSIPVLGGWLQVPVFREIFNWQEFARGIVHQGL